VFDRTRVYSVLLQAKGRFSRALLGLLIWKEHSDSEQKLLLSMMVSCGICFLHRHFGASDVWLAVLAGTQPRHRAQRGGQRRPPNACPRLRVVGDPWKPPAQLDSSRQLSLLIENGADRSISLGDDEHPKSMAVCTTAGKRDVADRLVCFMVNQDWLADWLTPGEVRQ
jgi:hypothetical protein